MKRNFLLFIIIVILASCTTFSDKRLAKDRLRSNLRIWEDFKLTGVVEVDYNQFQFRQNIYIKKQSDEFKLDIFKGGIFGLTGKKTLSISIENGILKSSGMIKIDSTKVDISILDFQIDKILKNDYEIISTNETEIDDAKFIFNDNLQLIKIIADKNVVEVEYQDEFPEIISINGKKFSFKILIDEFVRIVIT